MFKYVFITCFFGLASSSVTVGMSSVSKEIASSHIMSTPTSLLLI